MSGAMPITIAEQSVSIVDGCASFRDSLGALLAATGLAVHAYPSAIHFLADYRPKNGCLVADIRLPEMSGLELHEEIKRRGLAPEDRVDIHTVSSDGVERVVRGFKVVTYSIPDGSCAAYYPETNPLLPLSLHDPVAGTPSAKGIPVVLKPISTSTDSPPLSG